MQKIDSNWIINTMNRKLKASRITMSSNQQSKLCDFRSSRDGPYICNNRTVGSYAKCDKHRETLRERRYLWLHCRCVFMAGNDTSYKGYCGKPVDHKDSKNIFCELHGKLLDDRRRGSNTPQTPRRQTPPPPPLPPVAFKKRSLEDPPEDLPEAKKAKQFLDTLDDKEKLLQIDIEAYQAYVDLQKKSAEYEAAKALFFEKQKNHTDLIQKFVSEAPHLLVGKSVGKSDGKSDDKI